MNRKQDIDLLRAWAIISVVVLHSSANIVLANLYNQPISYWLAGNLYESLTRYGVPIFVMISGALLLGSNKVINYDNKHLQRILRIFLCLIAWSFIYYSHACIINKVRFSIVGFIKAFCEQKISGHLWFMYMISGIYTIVPLVNKLFDNLTRKELHILLLLWLYTSVIVGVCNHFIGISFNIELLFTKNYIGYFILGGYIERYDIGYKNRIKIYIIGLIGIISTFILTYLETKGSGGKFQNFWYEYFAINVVVASIAIFVIIKYRYKTININNNNLVSIISKYSLGIYLVHILIQKELNRLVFHNNLIPGHPIITIPLTSIVLLLISTLIVAILSKIPILRKIVL